MEMYYGGGEINAFGELLESCGVNTIAVSFMGLRRRIKHLDKVNLADRFSDGTRILLDSGCHTINNAPDKQYSDDELKQIADEYYTFVERNIGNIEAYTEFDALQLGREWIRNRTRTLKQITVWHEEDGIDELKNVLSRQPRVAVTGTSLGDRDLTPLLNKAVQELGTELYGLGMTKPEQMAEISWTGVSSTSWLSPVKFRDIIVWNGRELKRYPKKNRESGKKRHRTLFHQIGIDNDRIEDDDNNELLKLSIWSWRQQVASINGEPLDPKIADIPLDTPLSANAEKGAEGVVNYGRSAQNTELNISAPTARPKRLIPGMEVEEKQEPYFTETGDRRTRTLNLVRTNSDSILQCTGCYLAGKCPAFDPGSACVYDIPVEIRTKDQLAAVESAILEMQVRRVMLMHLAEQVDGGYADPNLSQEIDRANRMIKNKREGDAEGFSLTIKANQSAASNQAGAGVLSRLFGRDESQPARELPAAIPPKSVAEQLGIVDAEVIEEVRRDDAA
ncbi:hypothetical protein ACFYP4_02940 [Streptomyces sp. NPDC005551]|uniref:hypothetical protein n=1 Tax=Streptomyces sp. NPDC005551 TaxID=3364725 RepID=UPI0036C3C421